MVTKQDKSDAACYDFAPFSEEIPNTLGSRSSNACFAASFEGRHCFTGKDRDDESDLDYFAARYYVSNMGRFLSVDPKKMTTKKTRAIKSVQKGFLSLLFQPTYLGLISPIFGTELIDDASVLGYLLYYFLMLPIMPGFVVALSASGGNIHGVSRISLLAGLSVNMLLHTTCIYAILYFKETCCKRSTSGE